MIKRFIAFVFVIASLISNSVAGPGLSRPTADRDNEEQTRQSNISTKAVLGVAAVGVGVAVIASLFAEDQITKPTVKVRDPSLNFSETPEFDTIKNENDGRRKPVLLLSSPEKRVLSQKSVSQVDSQILTIDLSIYDEPQQESAKRIDLHPVYKTNPRQYLRQKIYEYQKNYHYSQSEEDMVRVITGTGKKRTGPNYTLQNNVTDWLQESYIQRRIHNFWLQDEGMFNVILRKNIE